MGHIAPKSVITRYRRDMRRASEYWGITRVAQVTPAMVREWVEHNTPAASTKLNRLAAVLACFRPYRYWNRSTITPISRKFGPGSRNLGHRRRNGWGIA